MVGLFLFLVFGLEAEERVSVRRFPDGSVFVTVRFKRWSVVRGEKWEWWEEQHFNHLPKDVEKFRSLLRRKVLAGRPVEVKDGVLAYLIVWKFGRKSIIAGFLWAMGEEFPGFRNVREETEVEEPYTTLEGKTAYRVVKRRVEFVAASPEDLVPTVGQCLSRLARGELVGRVR
jgi:hypothetical protein